MYKQNLNTMKKIFGLVAVVAIAALNVVVSNNNKEAELSDLQLENIEALAQSSENAANKGALAQSSKTGAYCCYGTETSNCGAVDCDTLK